VDIGAPLYTAEKAPAAPRAPIGPEAIVVQQATIQFDEKISLAAQTDGEIELIARPLPRDQKYDPKDPQYHGRLVPRPREKSWMHVRWVEGDTIQEGQTLAFLDDSQITVQVQSLEDSLNAANSMAKQGEASVGEIAKAVSLVENNQASTMIEKVQYRVQLAQTRMTQARSVSEQVKANGEYLIAKDKRQRHYLFSPFAGKLVRILKSPGEFVKAGEPIVEVQNTSRFRVEGKIDRQDAARISPYVPVLVEPIRSVGPEPYTARHRQEVTGIAVTSHKGKPMIVSASNDGTALVWDVTAPGEKKQHVLPHPSGTAVKCVATTRPNTDVHLAATGGSDGKIRLWDLTNPAQLPDKPSAEFEEIHTQAITAIAFSPDGRFLVTAAGRDVFLWDVSARKKKYSFPVEHKDDVKAMRFTPQSTLVTVCRDKAVRVWQLGSEGASVSRTLDHRSGAVDILGVSSDGGQVLFDQEVTRIDLVNLADGRTTGSLMNTGGGLRFGGLAQFSPDDKLVATGSGDSDTKGELQLWAALENGRWSERRRLVTQYRAAVTCAAFSADPTQRFIAVGTQTGTIHFWWLTGMNEQSALKGRVVSILPNDARTAQIRVEVENADGKLTDLVQDRGAATILIDPTAKPEPPILPSPQPNTTSPRVGVGLPMDRGVIPAGATANR
jgi:WD40 repeat protein